MKHRKCIAFLMLLALILSSSFADDFTAVGFGETVSDARSDALSTLAGQISTNVSTLVMTSSYEKDGENAVEQYGSSSLQASEFDLVGYSFGVPERMEDGLWRVEAVLPEASASEYYARLDELSVTIAEQFGELGNLADLDSVSYVQIDQLIDLLDEYESNRIVATSLDRSLSSSVPELPVSRSQVEAQRNAKLYAEETSIDQQLEQYDISAAFGLLTDEMERERQDLETRLSELRSDNEARIQALHEQTQARLAELSGIAVPELDAEAEDEAFSQVSRAIDSIMRLSQGLSAAKRTGSDAIERLDEEYSKEAEAYIAELMARPHAAIELDANGKPTATAISRRRAGAENEVRKTILPQYSQEINRQFGTLLDMMASNIKQIASVAQSIIGYDFILSSAQQDVSVAITDYDSEAGAFLGYAQVNIGGQDHRIDFSIPYADWSGENIPTYNDFFAYEEYLFVASQWINMLKDNTSLFILELGTSIQYDPIGYGIYMRIDSFSVTRRDTGERIISDRRLDESINLIELPFDLDALFDFSFSLDQDMQTGFNYKANASAVRSEEHLDDIVDLYGLDLESLSAAVLTSLRRMRPEDRAAMGKSGFEGRIDRQVTEHDKQVAKEDKQKVIDGFIEDSVLLIKPYAIGSFIFPHDGITQGGGGLGVEVLMHFNDTDDYINFLYSLSADVSLTGRKHIYVVDDMLHTEKSGMFCLRVLGGMGLLLHLDGMPFVGRIGAGVGFDAASQAIINGNVGASFPAGSGLVEVSLSLDLSVGIGEKDDFSAGLGITIGYMFDTGLRI